MQQRDFVNVHDVARACRLAMEVEDAAGHVLNIGSGRSVKVMGKPHIRPAVTGKYRMGDIRHCFADITLAREVLGYEPRVEFQRGLAEWLKAELEARGLTV
ncbi:epimerase [Archangium violaceum]|nr:epimerase [Archangium violaceum]